MFTVYFGVDNLIYRSFMEYIIKIHRWSEKSEETKLKKLADLKGSNSI